MPTQLSQDARARRRALEQATIDHEVAQSWCRRLEQRASELAATCARLRARSAALGVPPPAGPEAPGGSLTPTARGG